jgi:hypothetical protein
MRFFLKNLVYYDLSNLLFARKYFKNYNLMVILINKFINK